MNTTNVAEFTENDDVVINKIDTTEISQEYNDKKDNGEICCRIKLKYL